MVFGDHAWEEEQKREKAKVTVFDTNTLLKTTELKANFAISQVQTVGGDALLMGDAEEDEELLSLYSLSLNSTDAIKDSLTLQGYELAETRSHGFNYKHVSKAGLFALPLAVDVTQGATLALTHI